MHWTPADQAALDRWSDVVKTVAARQASPQESPFLANCSGWYPELVAPQRLVAAGLASGSEADFRKRAAGLALPEEVAVMSASLAHFEQRLAGRAAAFFESELPVRDFDMHLIPRSDRESKDATATFSRNHMVVELTDSMKPVGSFHHPA